MQELSCVNIRAQSFFLSPRLKKYFLERKKKILPVLISFQTANGLIFREPNGYIGKSNIGHFRKYLEPFTFCTTFNLT